MPQSATFHRSFAFVGPTTLVAAFDAGRATSDGGLPWLAAADRQLGVCAALAACVPEWRRGRVRHSREDLVRQRVLQIACGYADQDDADALRADPLLKYACGRLPESGPDLASQPTISRLENAVDRRAVEALAAALVELYVRARGHGGAPTRVVLDVDGTDDPAHGAQEGIGYHGYYRQYMYFPLLVFDGQTDHLITAVLRPGTIHGGRFVVLVLRRLVARLRAAWPGVAIEVRADCGCASPRLYAWCEATGVDYTLGLATNAVLARAAAPQLAQAQAQSVAQTGAKVRLVGETIYRAESWPRARRVVFKTEVLAKGSNTRFVLTTRTDPPTGVYDHYVARGEPENWIKDLKNALLADRLSDHAFWANAFRLLLHAAAYWLLDTLRRWLRRRGAERMQFDTLRLRLIKIGGLVHQLADRVHVHLASHHPGEHLWLLLDSRPKTPVNNPG
jgi:DDE family transposase